jgi:hypothetical protein
LILEKQGVFMKKHAVLIIQVISLTGVFLTSTKLFAYEPMDSDRKSCTLRYLTNNTVKKDGSLVQNDEVSNMVNASAIERKFEPRPIMLQAAMGSQQKTIKEIYNDVKPGEFFLRDHFESCVVTGVGRSESGSIAVGQACLSWIKLYWRDANDNDILINDIEGQSNYVYTGHEKRMNDREIQFAAQLKSFKVALNNLPSCANAYAQLDVNQNSNVKIDEQMAALRDKLGKIKGPNFVRSLDDNQVVTEIELNKKKNSSFSLSTMFFDWLTRMSKGGQ